jgi:hypothetical protein
MSPGWSLLAAERGKVAYYAFDGYLSHGSCDDYCEYWGFYEF